MSPAGNPIKDALMVTPSEAFSSHPAGGPDLTVPSGRSKPRALEAGASTAPTRDASPRVAFVLPWGLSLGGVEVFSTQMASRLSGTMPVSLFCYPPPQQASSAAYELPPELEVVSFDSELWGGIQPPNLERVASSLPACLIPNNCAEAYAAAAVLSVQRSAEIRVLGYYHGQSAEVLATLVQYEPIVHRFVAVSDECADEIRRALPHRRADVETRPCGVPVPGAFDHQYSNAGEPLRVLFAGRISEREKRVSDLLGVAEVLVERGIAFRLRIVGHGPDRAALIQRWSSSPAAIRERVSIEPSVPSHAMPELFAEHDAILMTSPAEGTSLFLLQAMASGCIPVVTDVSGTARLIQPGRNGFLAPVGDVAQLAGGLTRLAEDRVQLAQMGAMAFAAAQPYSLGEYEEWFRRLLTAVWAEPARQWPADRPLYPWTARQAYWLGRRLPLLRDTWRWIRGRYLS